MSLNNTITIFREEATSAIAGLIGSSILADLELEMLVFVQEEKTGDSREKPSQQGNNQEQTRI